MKQSVIAGVVAGVLTCLIYFGIYKVSVEGMLSTLTFFGTGIIYLAAMFGVNLWWKNNHNGVLPFRQAIRFSFITFLIANLIYHTFYWWLVNQDPTIIEIQSQLYEQFGGEELAAQMEPKDPTQIDTKVSIGSMLMQYAWKSIFGFILSLIIALLVKQNK